MPDDNNIHKRLLIACEQTKIRLSSAPTATVNLSNILGVGDGELIVEITNKEFNELCRPIFKRFASSLANILKKFGKAPS